MRWSWRRLWRGRGAGRAVRSPDPLVDADPLARRPVTVPGAGPAAGAATPRRSGAPASQPGTAGLPGQSTGPVPLPRGAASGDPGDPASQRGGRPAAAAHGPDGPERLADAAAGPPAGLVVLTFADGTWQALPDCPTRQSMLSRARTLIDGLPG